MLSLNPILLVLIGVIDAALAYFATLSNYDKQIPAHVAFEQQFHHHVLGEYLASLGLKQLHIAETEKYAHVTFFFNGGREKPFEGEERMLVPLPKWPPMISNPK